MAIRQLSNSIMLWVRNIIVDFIHRFILVPVQPDLSGIDTIKVDVRDVIFQNGADNLSSNNLLRIRNPVGYFRECHQLQSFPDFVNRIVSDFCKSKNIPEVQQEHILVTITKCLQNQKNRHKFLNMETNRGIIRILSWIIFTIAMQV